jgi:hypothetical protein
MSQDLGEKRVGKETYNMYLFMSLFVCGCICLLMKDRVICLAKETYTYIKYTDCNIDRLNTIDSYIVETQK